MNKKTFFYFDDVIWLFRDLTRERPESIFDHFYLKVLKEAHDEYGMKVQMNVFYRTDYFYGMDEFTLADMTDAYKDEFKANSDWLKFGFHALQEFPDYPFVNVSYEDMVKDFYLTKNEILRFADEKNFALAVCSHWRPISKEGCKALADNGIKLINCTGGDVREYDGDPSSLPYGHLARLLQNRQPETKIFTRVSLNKDISNSICSYNHLTTKQLEETNCNLKTVYDVELNVHFKRLLTHGVVINLSNISDMENEYEKMLNCEFATIGGHEQYFYRNYYGYQENHGEKLLKACEILSDNGFEFIFAEDLV